MYREFLDFIFPLAEGAGKIQLAYFRGDDLAIRTKSNVYDVVTRADKESEAYIAAAILERWPDHEILGEEGGSMGRAGSDYRWVVDPLDGTTNYSQGLPVFSVSIALQYRGETIVGVVYAPYLNELFWASKGGGAYMKSRSGEVKRLTSPTSRPSPRRSSPPDSRTTRTSIRTTTATTSRASSPTCGTCGGWGRRPTT